MWYWWWITEVRRLWWRLLVMRSVPGRGDVWCPSSDSGEGSGGRVEDGQGKLFQFSPSLQLDLRWAWDPGVSAGILWVYVGLWVRTACIRRSRGVKEKCRMLSSRKRGQWMVLQVSPRFRQLGGRWRWDPGASASVIWAYAGCCYG